MIRNEKRRAELRPQGFESPSCNGCQWRKDCGGFHNGRLIGNCFEETCCEFTGKDKDKCNAVCPYKNDFDDWLADTMGLQFDDLPTFAQPILDLPVYIPVIDHRSRRVAPLNWPVVSLTTYNVLRMHRGSGEYRAVSNDPDSLRDHFLLGKDTKIVLRGVARDSQLERYWENHAAAAAPAQLARLNIHAVMGPNFSHFLDVPRTDHLFNKRRQLLCLSDLHAAGMATVPHLNAVMPGDWRFWTTFLQRNSSVRVVAIEFQTGNKNPTQGKKAIEHLATVQNSIRRPLHPVLVGGAQYVEFVSTRFQQFTLTDSTPFIKALHRQKVSRTDGKVAWKSRFRLDRQDVDELLIDNIRGYSDWIEERARRARSGAILN